jgi:hypothetical protein
MRTIILSCFLVSTAFAHDPCDGQRRLAEYQRDQWVALARQNGVTVPHDLPAVKCRMSEAAECSDRCDPKPTCKCTWRPPCKGWPTSASRCGTRHCDDGKWRFVSSRVDCTHGNPSSNAVWNEANCSCVCRPDHANQCALEHGSPTVAGPDCTCECPIGRRCGNVNSTHTVHISDGKCICGCDPAGARHCRDNEVWDSSACSCVAAPVPDPVTLLAHRPPPVHEDTCPPRHDDECSSVSSDSSHHSSHHDDDKCSSAPSHHSSHHDDDKCSSAPSHHSSHHDDDKCSSAPSHHAPPRCHGDECKPRGPSNLCVSKETALRLVEKSDQNRLKYPHKPCECAGQCGKTYSVYCKGGFTFNCKNEPVCGSRRGVLCTTGRLLKEMGSSLVCGAKEGKCPSNSC